MAMTALRSCPRGRRTGSPRSRSQRCTVRTPRFRYAAISFHELSTLDTGTTTQQLITYYDATNWGSKDVISRQHTRINVRVVDTGALSFQCHAVHGFAKRSTIITTT